MSRCAIEIDTNKHHAEQEKLAKWEERVREAAEESMKPGREHDPFTPMNFMEAVGGMEHSEITAALCLLRSGGYAWAGSKLAFGVQNYWREIAIAKARETVPVEG